MRRCVPKDVSGAIGDGRNLPVSLLAEKYPLFPDALGSKEDKNQAKDRTIADIVRAPIPAVKDVPLAVFPTARPVGAVTVTLRLGGRLLVNQSGGVIEGAGLCVHRYFGYPYLPGSAVKGVARAAALRQLRAAAAKDKDAVLERILHVFGYSQADLRWRAGVPVENLPDLAQMYFWQTTVRGTSLPLPDALTDCRECAGTVSFLPAVPLAPGAGQKLCLVEDMVNCHHQKYYAGKMASPTDDEQPNPVRFPAVEAGCAFAFTLVPLPARRRFPGGFVPVEQAREWLIVGLQEAGAGAKTAAGYGWFEHDAAAETRLAEAQQQATAARAADRKLQEALNQTTPAEWEAKVAELAKLPDDQLRGRLNNLPLETKPDLFARKVLLLVLAGPKRHVWDQWKAGKQGLKQAGAVRAEAAKLGVALP